MFEHSTGATSPGAFAATIAAAYLAVGLAMVVVVMLVLEPAMGFTSVGDYMDPAKVAAHAASTPWLLVDLFYLSLFVPILAIARRSEDRGLLWAGVAGALGFFLVASIDRVAAQLPSLVSDVETRRVALMALLPVCLAVLKTAAMALALFAWRTTCDGEGGGLLDRAWRGMGYLVLATGVLFVFVFVPAPVVFFVWAALLTVRNARRLASAQRTVGDVAGAAV